jgi:hypothetical protein
MASRIYFSLLIVVTVFALAGCYTTPVRHLSADVALLQAGKSTRQDVIVFLGDPDEQQELGEGVEKWLYKEKDTSFVEKTPLLGRYLGAPTYNQVVVTFRNGIVIESVYSYSDDDDLDWANDFSWQEKKK